MSWTNTIILLCIVTSLLVWTSKPQAIEILLFSTKNFQAGMIWTSATTLFVHSNPLHLLGNILFLYVFGNTLENLTSPRKTIGTFFIGGIMTNILSMPFYPSNTILVGASAAIFTIAATVMLIKPLKFSWLFLLPVGLVAIIYFLFNIIAVYNNSSGGVAYISHVLGFLIGIPFGIALSSNWLRNLTITIALLIVYLFMIIFVAPIILNIIKTTLSTI